MKNAILEYLDYSPAEKKKLWDEGTFVFDTNILLNLYRYSKETREALLKAFNGVKPRVWLPYQIAYEFMKNRNAVIHEKLGQYEKHKGNVEDFCKEVEKYLRVDKKQIDGLRKQMQKWFEDYKKSDILIQNSDTNNDDILKQILEIFSERTGKKHTNEKISELKTEGKKRYENKIPPGYMDSGKAKSQDTISEKSTNEYGDFFFWTEILEYAKTAEKDIILVTDDEKEDWWEIHKGKTIGPRVELRREFMEQTEKKKFHMYSMNGFLDEYSKHKNIKIAKSVTEEIQDIKNSTLSNVIRPSDLWNALRLSPKSSAAFSAMENIANLSKLEALGLSPKSSAALSAMGNIANLSKLEALGEFSNSLYSKSILNKEIENILESSKNLLNVQNSCEENNTNNEIN